MADTARYLCQLDGCSYASEVVASWKLGRGAELPFTGGKVGQATGLHHVIQLCVRHRKQALAMDARPYKVMLTAWGAKPEKFDLVRSEHGDLLVPGVAVKS